jgi:hypothetical protein
MPPMNLKIKHDQQEENQAPWRKQVKIIKVPAYVLSSSTSGTCTTTHVKFHQRLLLSIKVIINQKWKPLVIRGQEREVKLRVKVGFYPMESDIYPNGR